jgi:phosphatidylglycerol phospholipase C
MFANDRPWTKSKKMTGLKPPMPECWGHRGASAAFPENTIASFERAIRDGAEGLESDVHVTSDDVVIMFHDPSLERTTDGKGLIRDQAWYGGIEKVRTKAKPTQQIPTFEQVCDLLMRPENRHVKLNIDIKPENDPERLFRLMKRIVEKYEGFATDLSPRLILGLWHPIFLRAALEHVPTLRRVHIGGSPMLARTYFWKHCDGFSMWFPSLVSTEGQNFLQQAREDGKDVFVWTVNRRDEMIEATRYGVKAILTDKTDLLRDVRNEMQDDFVGARSEQVGIFFRWATWRYYMLPQMLIQAIWISELEKRAGCTFKSAWKRDGLETAAIPESLYTPTPSTAVAQSPESLATLNDTEVPPLTVGKTPLGYSTAVARTPAIAV